MMEGGDFVRDIISDLPDSLLTHILSFLPTEEAVCTCILSKRWMNVWISLPILVFDDHKCREDNLTKEEFQKREDKFIRFLCGVISNREINLTLDTFKVTWWGNVRDTPLRIFGCLYCAIECRPRILSIQIKTCKFFYLPDSIFTCTSIEEMSLWLHIYRREVQFVKLGSFNLPFLKKLELGYLNLNDDIMRMLISGCPILEELILINCALEGNMISSNVLKKLVIKHCFHYAPMEISCPAVVSLSIESVNTEGIALKNMLSLIMAEIYCHAVFLFDTLHYDMRLLGGLSNVTSLKLYTRSPDVMGLMREDIPNCPILKNLKCLDLGVININDDWNLVTCLLKHSSNLKDLTLHFYRPSEEIVKEEFRGDISFQHEYLERVKINCPGRTVKLVEELVRTLGEHIETTSKIIIFCRAICFFKREIPDSIEREALRIEGWLYNQATSVADYVRSWVADYIEKIPENSGILQGDLTSQMGQQGDPGKDVLMAWLLSHANTTIPTQQQPQQKQPPAGPLTDSSILPPRQQPLPGPLTDSSSSTPPQQQPQQQLSGPNEHPMIPEHLLREELLALLKNMS